MNHNHMTRDIKPFGLCPGCDDYHRKTNPAYLGEPTVKEQLDAIKATIKTLVEQVEKLDAITY